MLEKIDNDSGLVTVRHRGKLVHRAAYDTRDRQDQKTAHANAEAYRQGWNDALASIGINAAGVPVFDPRSGEAAQ